MNCLCCGKPIAESAKKTEQESQWHTGCIKKFFGVTKMPDIDISEEMLEQLVNESINQGYTVPGVQKKLSLHLATDDNPRLTFVNYPTGYILKPQTSEYEALPEAEYLTMQMAEKTGIRTVPFALIRMKSQEDKPAYITKRIDRISGARNGETVQMLAMEDFCQLEGRLTQDKYKGSYERCAKVVDEFSSQRMLDQTELFLRIVFSFAVGNSDMHLKNFSLIETATRSGSYVLSAAYDMLPVNVILPEDKEQFALTMNGKKSNLRRRDFLTFADTISLPEKSAEKIIRKIVSMEEEYLEMCRNSLMPESMKATMAEFISERIKVLKGN